MDSNNTSLFEVKIATHEEVLSHFDLTNDISAILVFTYNSSRNTSWIEIVTVYLLFIVSFIFTFFGVQSSFHSTFPHGYQRSVYIFALVAWCELIASRTFVIYYQLTRVSTQTYSQSLFWAALFRYHYMFISIHIMFCSVFERIMATYYWRDYEKTKRVWIIWLNLVTANVWAAVYSFLTARGYIHMRFIFFYGIACTIGAMIILEVIYYFNRLKLNALDRNDKTVLYSLSIRYQIQENVRSIRIIRALVITVSLFIIGIIFGECLPILVGLEEYYLHLCNIVFDTMVHTNPIFVIPLSFVIYDDLRWAFIRKYGRYFLSSTSPHGHKKSVFRLSKEDKSKASDMYFEMFNKSVKFDKNDSSTA